MGALNSGTPPSQPNGVQVGEASHQFQYEVVPPTREHTDRFNNHHSDVHHEIDWNA